MPFEKKDIEDKMVRFSTTLTPKSYASLKSRSEKLNKPMSEILSELIEKHLPREPFWAVYVKE